MHVTDHLAPWGLVASKQSTILTARPISTAEARRCLDSDTRGFFQSPAIEQLTIEALKDEGSLFTPIIEPGEGMMALEPGGECLLVLSRECELSFYKLIRSEIELVKNDSRERFGDHLKISEKALSQLTLVANGMHGVLKSPESERVTLELQRLGSIVNHAYRQLERGFGPTQINEEIWPAAPGAEEPKAEPTEPEPEQIIVVEDPSIGPDNSVTAREVAEDLSAMLVENGSKSSKRAKAQAK